VTSVRRVSPIRRSASMMVCIFCALRTIASTDSRLSPSGMVSKSCSRCSANPRMAETGFFRSWATVWA
jgi:hypothetical protein